MLYLMAAQDDRLADCSQMHGKVGPWWRSRAACRQGLSIKGMPSICNAGMGQSVLV
jgi:hypothetical protein